jgi:hypothetical protein
VQTYRSTALDTSEFALVKVLLLTSFSTISSAFSNEILGISMGVAIVVEKKVAEQDRSEFQDPKRGDQAQLTDPLNGASRPNR